MMLRKTRNGFTLLEILTVLAVLSVVTTIGVQSFVRMSSLWGNTSASMELNAISVDIFGSMRDDFEWVASTERTGRAIQGIDALETERLVNRHKPEDDRLILPLFQRALEANTWEQIAVMYHIERTETSAQLLRTIGPSDGSEPAGAFQTIGEHVVAMNLAYLDQNNVWLDSWSNAEQPLAVRVRLTLGLARRPFDHISREAVFPIHVK